MESGKQTKVSALSKTAYGLGDASTTLLRLVQMSYLTYFYTDVAGIHPAAVGTMFLAARIFDAVNDPFFGYLVDNTHSRKGKCRPWFLGDAVPLGVFGALCFLSPDMSGGFKLAFAYITYIGYGIAATAVNIPLGAILPNMTNDQQERTNVNTWRMVFGQLAGAVSSVITIPLVAYLGRGNEKAGYFKTAALYGIFAGACLLFCYTMIRETVPEKQAHAKLGVRDSLRGLRGNVPLYCLMALTFFHSVYMTVYNSGAMYYLKYKVHNIALMSTLSLMNYASVIAMLTIPRLNRRFSKRNLVCFGFFLGILGRILILICSKVPVLYIGMFISGFGNGFATGLLYAMIADAIDYGEYKSGIRTQGVTFSAATFMEKLASSTGGALTGFVLSIGGYNQKLSVQSPSAIHSIEAVYLVIPIALCAGAIFIMHFYHLDKEMSAVENAL